MAIHPIVFLPYFLVGMLFAVGLDKVSILKWTWEPPPAHIKVLIGFLWPLWLVIVLVYAALGRVNK